MLQKIYSPEVICNFYASADNNTKHHRKIKIKYHNKKTLTAEIKKYGCESDSSKIQNIEICR